MRRSLDNMSGQIRWSLDLRWQRPGEPNGFYGLKDCIPMAKSGDPGFRLDWGAWAQQDRTPLQKVAVSADKHAEVAAAAEDAQGESLCRRCSSRARTPALLVSCDGHDGM